MVSYYNKHKGDLFPGHIAKSSDINQIQQNIQDALKNAISDLTEGESWILGTNDQSDKDAFILTPDIKKAGRYIDQMNLAEGNDMEVISFRETSYQQPIRLSRSSIYSVIIKLQNKSEISVPVVCELRDEYGNMIPKMRTVIELPKYTNEPAEFEVVFDLDYYPTAHNVDPENLENGNTQFAKPNTDEEPSFDVGIEYDDEDLSSFTMGASTVYFFVEALNKNKLKTFDVNTTQSNNYQWNDTDPTFGIVINKNSTYGQLLEESSGNNFVKSSTPGDLYFKEIYANAPTYQCNIGQAVIGGEKVMLASTHISVAGASSFGNVISYIYMDQKGRLKFKNSKPFVGNNPILEIPDEPHLHIANITTFLNDTKDPIIQQDDEMRQFRPRSHHERIRRLEKKLSYTQEIAIPPRIKYTRTGEDWIDQNPNVDLSAKSFNGLVAQNLDALNSSEYTITTDTNGNFIVKASKAESFSIPITLQNQQSGITSTEQDSTKIISSAQTAEYINSLSKSDVSRAQIFAEMTNMFNDFSEGKLTLSGTSEKHYVATTEEEAKKTEFNPWDDDQSNRPKDANVEPTTRSYTVVSGKNGSNDWVSEFPAMTLFTDTGYVLKKLEIPLYKFENCSGIKFFIYQRQDPNNKQNTVWLKKRVFTSDVFSLNNAKEKDGYQYMEDGFLIDFGNDGLTLEKGQYVIICLPIPKSDKGTVYVDTYKPEDSKDFCIRYYGAGNASHFLLKERYHEVWYNSVKASGEKITYSKSGNVVSGIISWQNKEAIKTIKPSVNLTTPEGTTSKIFVDVGGGWIEVEPDKDNSVIGSGDGESFRWKVEFTGNTTDTPTITYDKDKGYAINFEITRATPDTANSEQGNILDKNLCFTSKPFDANEILREYIGDYNLALTDNKFSNYEFARVWANDYNDSLIVDISASDRVEEIKDSNNQPVKDNNGNQLYYPVYSLHYVDLSLRDFGKTSVDYSNYDAELEEDENNLRLKLDTENSYNDNDIRVFNVNDFELSDETFRSNDETEGLKIDLTKVPSSSSNQVLAKINFINPLDLSKYASLRTGFTISGEDEGTLSGVALYISSQNEQDVPSSLPSEDLSAALVDDLPDLNSSQEDVIATYANQIVVKSYNNNGVGTDVYYKSIWNSLTKRWEWQQLHDVKSYNLYELSDRSTKETTITLSEENNGIERFFDIEIDPDSINLQFVKEIGLILINEDDKYSRVNVNSIEISDMKVIKNDYYPVFSAKEKDVFKANEDNRAPVECLQSGNMSLTTQHFTETTPETSSIKITHQNVNENGEELCSFDLTSKSTKGFNHIGIQIAADCLIVKHMLELHFKKVEDGVETVVAKVKLPTLNYIYYPITANNVINLAQVFKKIETSERFDKVVLYATPKFKEYAGKLKQNIENGNNITLYIGNISLYRAETIPIFHPMMRMKFYLDDASEIAQSKIAIRKVGAVLDYQ